ncbi:xyloglucan endotransglucosylase/hydrolase protein 2 [Phtheirospermum japonicum]|uniref:Xyloglucan endotransglucosylase/hydrolase protein 2 n=1 Tax=Phtheirospermum japonicum TaxID=374723 RepID=A0A830D805_9LAMI|nr:xyloglucan endotransglucosylase/hydrolase protein 2 [Phtheirospermum japonicum]
MAFLIVLTIFLGALAVQQANAIDDNFNTYYKYLWGTDHFSVNPQGSEVQLKMDKYSGAGFTSKLEYGSGVFRIRMKIPDKISGGVLTSFYLTEVPIGQTPGNHFEIDFEFPGTNGSVQTNVYDNDTGGREQTFKLWFDPSKDFHTYEFVWNQRQIVFNVDNIPIRVFKNNLARGIQYPTKAMHIEASIWNADWAGTVGLEQISFHSLLWGFRFRRLRWQCPTM